jgi:hypothetical protein
MAKLKITQTDSSGQIHDRYARPQYINGAYVGGTGGLTSQTGSQIQGQSYVTGASSQTCSILAQKGAHKFRVQDALGNKGICTLMNSPNVTAGKMNILITLNGGAANIAAANVAGGATSTTVTFDTRTTVTGPVTFPRVGDYVIWTSPSANIGSVVQVTGVTGTTSFTIGTTGNVAASTGTAVTTNTYASKISNNYVWDWTSDGYQDSTSGSSFYPSGYNPNRFRYHLATQDATFVKVQYA